MPSPAWRRARVQGRSGPVYRRSEPLQHWLRRWVWLVDEETDTFLWMWLCGCLPCLMCFGSFCFLWHVPWQDWGPNALLFALTLCVPWYLQWAWSLYRWAGGCGTGPP